MQVHQVVIRPQGGTIVLLYLDKLGQRYTMTLDQATIPAASQVVLQCQAQLPADGEHPAKSEIEQEISELEKRVSELKEAIGTT